MQARIEVGTEDRTLSLWSTKRYEGVPEGVIDQIQSLLAEYEVRK